ncbi:uncharacterized protein LOC134697041 [Mytilus trossulus]|uniref:uncharacterized protein LOC134697041 n=1 Tax=Mytilus trossulus TaxID=6551 RepID=UPI003004FE4D
MVLRVILIVLIAVCLTDAWWGGSRSSGSSSSGSRSGSSRSSWGWGKRGGGTKTNTQIRPHDMNKNRLTNLYNSKVTKVESYSRPLNGFLGKLGIKHTGVVATTKDGGRYLIHKGSGYGTKSSTIVLNAKHMSKNWKKTGEKLTNGKTISNLMKDGYVNKKYGVGPNSKICWQSSGNIMDKAGRRKRVAC